jgi:hypothetical protein
LAALWDPNVRWDALAVRTEPWIGLFWALILRELAGRARGEARRMGWIAGWLALAAWFHYEAVYLVPGLAVALLPRPRQLWDVGWRTLAFLSPWVLFALWHFPLFWSQMGIAFHRLGHGNTWVANPYLLFHSLFMWLGSPEGTPKFFNLGKAIFWSLAVALSIRAGMGAREKHGSLRLGAATTFWMGLFLWVSKPEVWYTTVCHVALWSWVALELALESRGERTRPVWKTLRVACAAWAGLAILATAVQAFKIPPSYNWVNYRAWVDCIERRIGPAPAHVWEPNYPDVLVELSARRPDLDLTRALDFEALRSIAENFGRQVDAVVFARIANWDADRGTYVGPERESDLALLTQSDSEMPFGPWAARELGGRERGICQVGGFWADVFRLASPQRR